MPRLWSRTIEAHRRDVRDAILRSTAALVAEHGLLAVTMSRIADETGIGRATLYKYFPDVESILLAWHERQIAGHLERLATARAGAESAEDQLRAVLEEYALIHRERSRYQGSHRIGSGPAEVLHGDARVAHAERRVHGMVRDLLAAAAREGAVRTDVPVHELASYCVSAVAAAGRMSSNAAARRLVDVVLAGLR